MCFCFTWVLVRLVLSVLYKINQSALAYTFANLRINWFLPYLWSPVKCKIPLSLSLSLPHSAFLSFSPSHSLFLYLSLCLCFCMSPPSVSVCLSLSLYLSLFPPLCVCVLFEHFDSIVVSVEKPTIILTKFPQLTVTSFSPLTFKVLVFRQLDSFSLWNSELTLRTGGWSSWIYGFMSFIRNVLFSACILWNLLPSPLPIASSSRIPMMPRPKLISWGHSVTQVSWVFWFYSFCFSA